MTKIDLVSRIAEVHNRLADIAVKGDGAILMGDALKELRFVVQDVQQNGVQDEQEKTANTREV